VSIKELSNLFGNGYSADTNGILVSNSR